MDLCATAVTLPLPGQTITANQWTTSAGGKGLNQAVAVQRLGMSTSFIGCVGDDAFGQLAIRELRASGVSIEGIRIAQGASTGTAAITIDASGQNTIVLYPGSNSLIGKDDIDRAAQTIGASKIVMLQMEVPSVANRHAALLARRFGVPVCFDPAPVGNVRDVFELLRLSDIVTPNESETLQLTGQDPSSEDGARAAARTLMRAGAKIVVLKLGARGAFLMTAEKELFVPAFVVDAIDTVAAGDCFNAGLAVAFANGLQLEDCVRYGAAAGALATTKRGGSGSAPGAAEVENLLKTG